MSQGLVVNLQTGQPEFKIESDPFEKSLFDSECFQLFEINVDTCEVEPIKECPV